MARTLNADKRQMASHSVNNALSSFPNIIIHRTYTNALQAHSFRLPPFQSFSRRTHSYGTHLQPSKVDYEYVEEVERLDFYVRGGYHPVMIGDEFCKGRYVIAHKLGFGRSATVWLAEDRERHELVALKISTAESANRTRESQILSQLKGTKSRLSKRCSLVPTLLDSFTFTGPNGTHQCLVTDAARISVHEAKDAAYHRLLHLPAARVIASQLIIGLQFIHSQGIVHGGMFGFTSNFREPHLT